MPHSGCSALHGVNPGFKKNLPIACLLLIIMFPLQGKEKLLKHQKVPKYYGHDCNWTGFVFDLEHTFSGGIRNSAMFHCH